jgi:hypothetical protein
MKRMFESYDKIGPARKKQIDRHAPESKAKAEIGLPEDIRVHHSSEYTPHDGDGINDQ